MRAALKVGRVFGIDIQVHVSWLLIFVLLAWTLSEVVFPDLYEGWSTTEYWVVGVASALLLFVTVLLHELAHAVVALRRGLPVPRITLFIFGGVSELGRQPATAREELAIAIAGPITSFIAAAVCGAIALVTGFSEQLQAAFTYLATVNVVLGVFNLIPGFPLDGGRVLRSLLWERTRSFAKATRIAVSVGEFVAYSMLVLGAFLLLGGLPTNGLWLMLIGWFVLSAARAEAASTRLESVLGRLTASQVMDESFAVVPETARLKDVVDEVMLGRGHRAVVVSSDGRMLGIATVTDTRKVNREEWASSEVGAVMTRGETVISVPPDAPAVEVLSLLGEKRLNQVPVIENGRILGMVSRRELLERLSVADALSG